MGCQGTAGKAEPQDERSREGKSDTAGSGSEINMRAEYGLAGEREKCFALRGGTCDYTPALTGGSMDRSRKWLFGTLVLAALCSAPFVVSAADSAETPSARARAKGPKRPLIVMKQAETRGRVYLLGGGGRPEKAAAGLKVRVRTEDGKKLLQETTTDEEGWYTLAVLDVGFYSLTFGRLQTLLQVETPGETADDTERSVARKTILVFIPEDLAE
jgi:hypothetical protein